MLFEYISEFVSRNQELIHISTIFMAISTGIACLHIFKEDHSFRTFLGTLRLRLVATSILSTPLFLYAYDSFNIRYNIYGSALLFGLIAEKFIGIITSDKGRLAIIKSILRLSEKAKLIEDVLIEETKKQNDEKHNDK